MQKTKKIKFDDKIALILSAILGVVVFLLLYGPYTLDVTNDAWILLQYDGTDTMQHYAGWAQYRISNWYYPLGYADKLASWDGTYITYTDCIPYLAIILKVFRNILPQRFQYFGWFMLLCFVLQGVAACLLLKRRIRSYIKLFVGEMFFLTAPIFIERNFKHTALSAHWLILFAIYYYLEYRKKEKEAKLPWQMIVLVTLTVGIHPYFLPMVMMMLLLVVIEAVIKKYSILKTAGYGILSVVLPYTACVVIGAVGTDMKDTRAGYGYFGMNLNALFNPQSASGYQWSKVLSERRQIYSTYEGFNYLGLGMLIMIVICALLLLTEIIRNRESIGKIGKIIKRNIPLISGMLFMTLFAVTNNLTWDNKVIFSIPLSEELIELGNIFRSSGRMFWPVYYLIMLTCLYYLFSVTWKNVGSVLVISLLMLQLFDMGAVYKVRRERMEELQGLETLLDDENLKNIEGKDTLVVIGTENFEVQRVLAVWAAQQNIGVAYGVASAGVYEDSEWYTQWCEEGMWEGIIRDNVVYVTFDEDVIQLWREKLVNEEYVEYKRGFYYFVYTK